EEHRLDGGQIARRDRLTEGEVEREDLHGLCEARRILLGQASENALAHGELLADVRASVALVCLLEEHEGHALHEREQRQKEQHDAALQAAHAELHVNTVRCRAAWARAARAPRASAT